MLFKVWIGCSRLWISNLIKAKPSNRSRTLKKILGSPSSSDRVKCAMFSWDGGGRDVRLISYH